MISYYSAVFVTALLLLGLLQYAVRKGSRHQKILVFKVVCLTTAIAFLLPTLLHNLTLLQTGILMAILAALGGALVPVAELLPARITDSEHEGLKINEAVTTEEPAPVVRKEGFSEEEFPEAEMTMVMDQEISEDVKPTVTEEYSSEDLLMEEKPEPDETLKEMVQDEVALVFEEAEREEAEAEEAVVIGDALEDQVVKEASQGLVLPSTFSETMAEVMLMNGYLALKDDEEEEAVRSFIMVCQRSQLTDQRMMAYMELKRLLPEIGRMECVIQLGDELLAGEVSLTTLQKGYIEKHTHYLKRLVSLLNAHGVSLEQPYSAMPDELKEMAMAHHKQDS